MGESELNQRVIPVWQQHSCDRGTEWASQPSAQGRQPKTFFAFLTNVSRPAEQGKESSSGGRGTFQGNKGQKSAFSRDRSDTVMTELNPLLTSWRQVYWIWYGATFSSPLISTLICRRIAPDTADLSVRFSRRKNHQQLHAFFMFRAQPSWGRETGKATAGSSSWACDQSHHGVNFRLFPFKILKDWLYANLSDSKCATGSLNLDSVSWTRTCKDGSLF